MISSILHYFEKTAEAFPSKIAYQDIYEAYSFSDLLQLSQRIGTYISNIVNTKKPVIVYLDKRVYNISVFLGVIYAGCFYVPIDSQMPSDRVNLIMDTLQPSLVIYDDITDVLLNQIKRDIKKVHYKEAEKTEIDQERLDGIRVDFKNTDLIYVLFTSGSTGIPKGVTISHAAVIDFLDWICEKYKLDSTNILCNQAPFYFDASVPDIYIPLKTGATLHIPPKMYYTFPKKILQFIVEKNINTLIWVPSALCNVVNCNAFDVLVPTTIKLVIFCGEIMPCKHLNIWRRYVPDALYVNMYGPTEATYACMYYNINREFKDHEKLPLGKACENSEILLINDNNKEATEGEIGEICILGQCLSSGYFHDSEKTSLAFVQNPLNSNWIELMYRTGDLAYRKDGEIIFVGRKDFQVKRLGYRIELGEIENAVLSISRIENACCLFNHKTNDIIVAYTGGIDALKISAILRDRIPDYMFPSKFEHLESMPMNLHGKIDRIKLKKQYVGE